MRPPEDAVAASTLTGQSLPIANDDTVRRYTRELIGRHRRAFLTVIALHSVAAVAGLAGPFVLGGIVNGLTGEPTTWSIDQAALIFIVALVVQTIFTRMSRLAARRASCLADLREDFLTRAVNLPTGVIERAGTGDLVSRTTTDIDRLTWAVRHAIPEISIAIVTAVLVLVALVVSAPTLALPWLLAVLPIWLSSRWYFARAPQAYRAESSTYAQVSASVAETVDAASTVELYRLEQGRIGVTDARIRRWVSWERYTLWLRCSWFPFIEMGYVLPLVGVLVWGGWQVSQGQITLGQLTTGLLLTQMLVEPVDQILMWYDELQVGQASLARLVGVRDVPDPETDPDLEPVDDRLVVDDVRFGYRVGRDVLHGIDLDVAPGERLALVGPSGAGKSTLGRLMAGIYAPRTGSVEMGGAELARMPAESVRALRWRSSTRSTTSSSAPYATTSLLARPDADDDALVAALDAVDARPWFDELPRGPGHRGRAGRPRARARAVAAARARAPGARRPAHPGARRGDLAARPARRAASRALAQRRPRGPHRHRHRAPAAHRARRRPHRRRRGRPGQRARHPRRARRRRRRLRRPVALLARRRLIDQASTNPMGRLVALGITSLDGYVNDADGSFAWAEPDEGCTATATRSRAPSARRSTAGGCRAHALLGRPARRGRRGRAGGRRRVADPDRSWSPDPRRRHDAAHHAVAVVRRRRRRRAQGEHRARHQRRGPTLAAAALEAGLVDEVGVILLPVTVGGGTAYLPAGVRLDLELVAEHRVTSGAVHRATPSAIKTGRRAHDLRARDVRRRRRGGPASCWRAGHPESRLEVRGPSNVTSPSSIGLVNRTRTATASRDGEDISPLGHDQLTRERLGVAGPVLSNGNAEPLCAGIPARLHSNPVVGMVADLARTPVRMLPGQVPVRTPGRATHRGRAATTPGRHRPRAQDR